VIACFRPSKPTQPAGPHQATSLRIAYVRPSRPSLCGFLTAWRIPDFMITCVRSSRTSSLPVFAPSRPLRHLRVHPLPLEARALMLQSYLPLLSCTLILHSYPQLLRGAFAVPRRPTQATCPVIEPALRSFSCDVALNSSSIGLRRGPARIMRALDEPFGHRATDPLPTSASSSPVNTSTASRASRYHFPRQRRRNNASASTNPSSPALPLRRSSVAAPPYTIWRRHVRGNRRFVLFFLQPAA
jgi:hypothetical protein